MMYKKNSLKVNSKQAMVASKDTPKVASNTSSLIIWCPQSKCRRVRSRGCLGLRNTQAADSLSVLQLVVPKNIPRTKTSWPHFRIAFQTASTTALRVSLEFTTISFPLWKKEWAVYPLSLSLSNQTSAVSGLSSSYWFECLYIVYNARSC